MLVLGHHQYQCRAFAALLAVEFESDMTSRHWGWTLCDSVQCLHKPLACRFKTEVAAKPVIRFVDISLSKRFKRVLNAFLSSLSRRLLSCTVDTSAFNTHHTSETSCLSRSGSSECALAQRRNFTAVGATVIAVEAIDIDGHFMVQDRLLQSGLLICKRACHHCESCGTSIVFRCNCP